MSFHDFADIMIFRFRFRLMHGKADVLKERHFYDSHG